GGRTGGRRLRVLEGGALGCGLGCLVVARLVVGDGVEAVAAVDGFAGGARHGVVEGGAAVGVGVREGEAAVSGLLDVELDARDTRAGGGVGGVRVDRDRAGVVELGAGRTGAGGGRVGLDGEGVRALGVAGFVG